MCLDFRGYEMMARCSEARENILMKPFGLRGFLGTVGGFLHLRTGYQCLINGF